MHYYNDSNNHATQDRPPHKKNNHLTTRDIPIVCKKNELHIFVSKYMNAIRNKIPKQILNS